MCCSTQCLSYILYSHNTALVNGNIYSFTYSIQFSCSLFLPFCIQGKIKINLMHLKDVHLKHDLYVSLLGQKICPGIFIRCRLTDLSSSFQKARITSSGITSRKLYPYHFQMNGWKNPLGEQKNFTTASAEDMKLGSVSRESFEIIS